MHEMGENRDRGKEKMTNAIKTLVGKMGVKLQMFKSEI